MKDLMLDLETFDNAPNSVIVQIGACYFDRCTGDIGDTFTVNIDPRDSVKYGFSIGADTVCWWLDQSKEAQTSILDTPSLPVSDSLDLFNAFAKKARHVWSHATFDFVIIMNHYEKMNIKPKFHYRSARDIRTLVDLVGGLDWSEYKRVGTHHNALDDCIYQVKYTVDAMRKLGVVK